MSTPSSPESGLYRWRFGSAEFDEARHELRVGEALVEIEHKPLQVLALLLRHAGEVVTKEELFAEVWAGRPTVDHVLSTAVGKLRKALGGEAVELIVTVPRIGYRFAGRAERIATGRRLASELSLEADQPVPGREPFLLERQLGRTRGSEVWLARRGGRGERRVFKFGLDGEGLAAIKREATVSRVLRESLGGREDFVRVLDWNLERPPCFLECEYGGRSLGEWAEAEDVLSGWTQAQRLAFFLRIAEAVAAAHGIGVLHKDLKPGNILVERDGGGWRPRLTDFGSSRLLQPERLDALGITALGLTRTVEVSGGSDSGTPLYLAPEVIGGQVPTVQSDLYALGVLLYQIVVGDLRRPMAPGWEHDVADPLLCEDIARATDGSPARRLGSVAELVERLSGLAARHEERRHAAAAAAEAAAAQQALQRMRARRPWLLATVAVLVAGLVSSLWLYGRSLQEQQRARQQAARAEAVVRFLGDDLLGALSPGGAGFERDPTIRELLEQASNRLAGRFGDDPATRGGLHAVLGDAWRTLGERERAAGHLREAANDHARAFGDADEATLKARYALVRSLAYAGSAEAFAEAADLLEAADRAAGGRLDAESELALAAAIARGQLHFQQLQIEPSLEAHRRADRLQRALRPDDAHAAALIRSNLADAALRQGRNEEAAEQLRAMLADPLLDAARIGESPVAGHRAMLARALRNLGRYDEALPLAQAAAATSERVLGEDHYSTLIQLSTVASIHDAAGDCPRALAVARVVRARMAARYGEDRQATLVETGNLGFKEYDCGDREAGLAYLRQAERGLRERYGAGNVAAHSFRYGLAKALTAQGRYREALEMAEGLDVTALTAGDSTPGWEHRLDALRGEILIRSGERRAGRELLAAAVAALDAVQGEEPERLEQLRALLGEDGGDEAVAGAGRG